MCVSTSLGQALSVIASHLKLEKCTNPELREQRKREENLWWEGILEDFPGEVTGELHLEGK